MPSDLICAGRLLVDVAGTELTAEEVQFLAHPVVGGVILFARNCQSPEQISRLVGQIREVSRNGQPALIVAVDQEGGRVQRIRSGATILPPARWFGERFDHCAETGLSAARDGGWLMAYELRQLDIDLSFAPVIDVDSGICEAIGDRAFHSDPKTIVQLVRAYVAGMHEGGMCAVGKHFPGHGSVSADSHLETPVDARDWRSIEQCDWIPFKQLASQLDALMTAHIKVPAVSSKPVTYSKEWLALKLREQLGFRGVVVSDDLSMLGANEEGTDWDTPSGRALSALDAGCDLVMICNAPADARDAAEQLATNPPESLASRTVKSWASLAADKRHRVDASVSGAEDSHRADRVRGFLEAS